MLLKPPYSILIVEDEETLGATLLDFFVSKGHLAQWCKSSSEALAKINDFLPDVFLLDISLPDETGLVLAKKLLEIYKHGLVIFVSALSDPQTRLEGLELGAIDFISKPFTLKELTIKLERLWQGHSALFTASDELIYGALKIRFSKYEVTDGMGKIIKLNYRECAILKLLHDQKGEAVSREQIIASIWGEFEYPSTRTIDNYIVHLRKWCDSDPDKTLSIESIRRVGYRLVIHDHE